jgi:hypothetical protein
MCALDGFAQVLILLYERQNDVVGQACRPGGTAMIPHFIQEFDDGHKKLLFCVMLPFRSGEN